MSYGTPNMRAFTAGLVMSTVQLKLDVILLLKYEIGALVGVGMSAMRAFELLANVGELWLSCEEEVF
jgi:hypothetical protein